ARRTKAERSKQKSSRQRRFTWPGPPGPSTTASSLLSIAARTPLATNNALTTAVLRAVRHRNSRRQSRIRDEQSDVRLQGLAAARPPYLFQQKRCHTLAANAGEFRGLQSAHNQRFDFRTGQRTFWRRRIRNHDTRTKSLPEGAKIPLNANQACYIIRRIH